MGEAIGSIIGAVQRSSEGMERAGKIIASSPSTPIQGAGGGGQNMMQDYEELLSKYFAKKGGDTAGPAGVLSQGFKIDYKPMSLEP